jgi:uncharacterized protein YsxB (DUF464 family)
MTSVTVYKKGGRIARVVCDGHTGYGVAGEDIVCAALSSVVQTAVLGLVTVAAVNVDIKRDDKKAYIEFTLPEALNETKQTKADVILDTMLLGVSDLYQSWSDFIELEIKGE